MLLSGEVKAAPFSTSGPFASASAVPSRYRHTNGNLMTWQNCINNGFDIGPIFNWIYSQFGTRSSTPIQVDITVNSASNWAGRVLGSCQIIVMYYETIRNAMVYPLLDSNGNMTGYGFKENCHNLVRFDIPSQPWESEGETRILSDVPGVGWTDTHPRGNEMEVDAGASVRWRHQVHITNFTGNQTINLSLATTQSPGVSGGDATWSGHAVTVNTATQPNTGWMERTWRVPDNARAGDVFCQYLRWSPRASDNNGEANSRDNREQCVRVREVDADTCPPLTGTTTLNGSSTDITVAPGASVTWTHTLSQTPTAPPSAFEGAVTFTPQWTSGGSGTIPGGDANLPLTMNQVRTSTATVEEGQRVCQNMTWQVPGHPECAGQTAPVCASTLVSGGTDEYVSTLRTCAIRQRAITGGTIQNCVDGALGNPVPAPSPNPTYAMTQDTLRFRHELNKLAQHQSRQRRNYIPLPNFNVSRTRCATNPTQAQGCEAQGPNLTYNPPTSPGQTAGVVLNPSWLNPPMEPWNIASRDCTLIGPEMALSGLSPATCAASEADLVGRSQFTFEGTGRRVVNADLGLTADQLNQRISLNDVRIRVHRNNDTHTYIYRYRSRQQRTVTPAADCGCFLPFIPCTPTPFGCIGGSPGRPACPQPGGVQYWFGNVPGRSLAPVSACLETPGALSNGELNATGTYQENEHTWIEVMPDGPLQAEASFAIPYNYIIQPQLGFLPANPNRIQVGGTELSFTPSLQVIPRFDSRLGETYATATRPDTRWRVISFYLPPETPNPNWGSNMTQDGGVVSCNSFSPQAFGCNHNDGMGSLNQQSETNIWNLTNPSTFSLGMQSHILADAPIGTKFCVVTAVSDRDSTHNNGFGQVSGNLWAMTTPECVVIGKQPMVNVLGDGLFSEGAVEGTVFEKRPQGHNSTGAFGSWVEYEIVSGGPVRNIASGAALGVGAIGVGGGFGGVNLPTAILLDQHIAQSSCRIAPLTFRNTTCSPLGHAQALGEMTGAMELNAAGRARLIRHRYTNMDNANVVPAGSAISLSGYSERMNPIRVNGAVTINASTIQPGRTVIVDATGPVTIAGNITLHDGPYTDISQIPQVLIFAPSINIAPSVGRVDAWLLAGLNGGTGTINTCRDTAHAAGTAAGGVLSVSDLHGNICTNQLRVNGPTMASRVLLHRTYGAGIGMPASARPAEAFFLSPATYLWSWNQSELLRQAFLTYAREVAPRF